MYTHIIAWNYLETCSQLISLTSIVGHFQCFFRCFKRNKFLTIFYIVPVVIGHPLCIFVGHVPRDKFFLDLTFFIIDGSILLFHIAALAFDSLLLEMVDELD